MESGRLAANGKERLVLRIIPRESKPFDLAVRWDYKPVASQAMIEVQEPKVAMRLEGPREVHYGRREVFTLKLANTGTGDAENVVVALTPMARATISRSRRRSACWPPAKRSRSRSN